MARHTRINNKMKTHNPFVYVLKQEVIFLNERKHIYYAWLSAFDVYGDGYFKELLLNHELVLVAAPKYKIDKNIKPPFGFTMFSTVSGDILAFDNDFVNGREKLLLKEKSLELNPQG